MSALSGLSISLASVLWREKLGVFMYSDMVFKYVIYMLCDLLPTHSSHNVMLSISADTICLFPYLAEKFSFAGNFFVLFLMGRT